MKRVYFIGFIIFYLSFFHNLYAEKDFSFSAFTLKSQTGEGQEYLNLNGTANIKSKNVHLYADQISLYGPEYRYARADMNISLKDIENDIELKTHSIFFDRTEEKIQIDEFVLINIPKEGIVIRGNYLDYSIPDNQLIIQINVNVVKQDDEGDLIAKAEYALYNSQTKKLRLSGQASVFWKENHYTANMINIDTDSNDIWLSGNITGLIQIEEEEEEVIKKNKIEEKKIGN